MCRKADNPCFWEEKEKCVEKEQFQFFITEKEKYVEKEYLFLCKKKREKRQKGENTIFSPKWSLKISPPDLARIRDIMDPKKNGIYILSKEQIKPLFRSEGQKFNRFLEIDYLVRFWGCRCFSLDSNGT